MTENITYKCHAFGQFLPRYYFTIRLHFRKAVHLDVYVAYNGKPLSSNAIDRKI